MIRVFLFYYPRFQYPLQTFVMIPIVFSFFCHKKKEPFSSMGETGYDPLLPLSHGKAFTAFGKGAPVRNRNIEFKPKLITQ